MYKPCVICMWLNSLKADAVTSDELDWLDFLSAKCTQCTLPEMEETCDFTIAFWHEQSPAYYCNDHIDYR